MENYELFCLTYIQKKTNHIQNYMIQNSAKAKINTIEI